MNAPRKPIESRPVATGASENGQPPPERKPPTTRLGRDLYNLVSDIGMGFMVAGDSYCGSILLDNAAQLATAWDNLAKRNARVKEVLEKLVSGGAYGEVLIATVGVALPIAQHHGIYPRSWPLPMSLGMAPPPPSEEVRTHGSTTRARPPAAGDPATRPPGDKPAAGD